MAFHGSASLSIPDRRVLMQPALAKDLIDVISHSTNEDASGPRSTMLRPGNILVEHATTMAWYDDVSGGQASAPATVVSSEVPDSDWNGSVTTVQLDGVTVAAVTESGGIANVGAMVTQLNANGAFAAHCVAAADTVLRITARDPGVHLKVTSDLATAFGASGQAAFPTEADIAVTLEYCDQLDAFGTAADKSVHCARAGVFDESQLLFTGAAATSSAYWPDFKRILTKRGSRFE